MGSEPEIYNIGIFFVYIIYVVFPPSFILKPPRTPAYQEGKQG